MEKIVICRIKRGKEWEGYVVSQTLEGLIKIFEDKREDDEFESKNALLVKNIIDMDEDEVVELTVKRYKIKRSVNVLIV